MECPECGLVYCWWFSNAPDYEALYTCPNGHRWRVVYTGEDD